MSGKFVPHSPTAFETLTLFIWASAAGLLSIVIMLVRHPFEHRLHPCPKIPFQTLGFLLSVLSLQCLPCCWSCYWCVFSPSQVPASHAQQHFQGKVSWPSLNLSMLQRTRSSIYVRHSTYPGLLQLSPGKQLNSLGEKGANSLPAGPEMGWKRKEGCV